jgi:hypothetical protein
MSGDSITWARTKLLQIVASVGFILGFFLDNVPDISWLGENGKFDKTYINSHLPELRTAFVTLTNIVVYFSAVLHIDLVSMV